MFKLTNIINGYYSISNKIHPSSSLYFVYFSKLFHNYLQIFKPFNKFKFIFVLLYYL